MMALHGGDYFTEGHALNYSPYPSPVGPVELACVKLLHRTINAATVCNPNY